MKTLHLHYSKLLQGDFKVGSLNFLFVFQVNCPGCFFYGIPVVNQLYLDHNEYVNFLGLSTAFEDFELNTSTNTSLLLRNNLLIGETKKAMLETGYTTYPQNINFPIAMDQLVSNNEIVTRENIETICLLNPNYPTWASSDQDELKQRVRSYLSTLHQTSLTFTLNQLKGTPSFIIFDKDLCILEQWFGHKQPKEVHEIINKWIQKINPHLI